MPYLRKVLFINLLILAAYWVLCKVYCGGPSEQLGFMLLMMLCIALHVVALFAAGISFAVRGEKPRRNAYLTSAGLTLLVGFSSCLGGAAL
ncbi:MAG: hypothetical protein JST90_12260 [Bacteroidetes bacterium]|nr:hypothetical protein [Bacteroidota bacterium]